MAAELALGTAQLGMTYGIANRRGKPERQEARQLLMFCADHGLTLWDTSPAYGDSEQIIGEVLLSLAVRPRIATKLSSINRSHPKHLRENELRRIVRRAIETSLSSLAIERIDLYLIHDEQDFVTYGSDLLAILDDYRRDKTIDQVGISVYSPDIAARALSSAGIRAIQLPFNIFDRRFQSIISQAAAQDVTIFARSVFLQGLFFLSTDEAIERLPPATCWVSDLQRFSRECNRSVAELALCYVRDTFGVTAIVVGAESEDQVETNLRLMSAPPLSQHLRDQIDARFCEVPLHVVNPVLWNQKP